MSRPQGGVRRITQVFWSSFQQEFLSTSSEFTFGDNSDMLSILKFLMNLVDRDLTEYQITQTLTLSRLHAQLEQTKGIRLFTHTQHVDWSRQGESDCLITIWSKQVILPFNAVRFERFRGLTSWNGSMTNTAWLRSTHRRCFSCWNLVRVVYVGKPWRTGADREYSSFTDCGRDRRGEQILDLVEQYPEPLL